MPSKKTRTPFQPGKVYHMYNRGNNRERLFYKNSNFKEFLKIFSSTLKPLIETYAYCLIPNHFHFLFRVNENTDYRNFNRQLRRWFIKYALKINHQENRTGALFTRPVNRLVVENEAYLKDLIFYINTNPVKHGVSANYYEYTFSSYLDIIKGNKGIVECNKVLNLFNNNIEEYIDFHKAKREIVTGEKLLLEK